MLLHMTWPILNFFDFVIVLFPTISLGETKSLHQDGNEIQDGYVILLHLRTTSCIYEIL